MIEEKREEQHNKVVVRPFDTPGPDLHPRTPDSPTASGDRSLGYYLFFFFLLPNILRELFVILPHHIHASHSCLSGLPISASTSLVALIPQLSDSIEYPTFIQARVRSS